MASRQLPAIDLFCGPGGMSLGLSRAGFAVVTATDVDPRAAQTYRRNRHHHKGTTVIVADLAVASAVDLLEPAGVGRSDVVLVAGGPPCKGFSSANGKTRQPANPHNALVDHYFRIVAEIRPRFFLMENVMGILWFHKGFLQECRHFRKLLALGYSVDMLDLNALDYGVPQNRRRLLLLGHRDEECLPPVALTRRPSSPQSAVTVGEAILGDLPRRALELVNSPVEYCRPPQSRYQAEIRGRARKAHNHVVTRNSERVKMRMSKVPIGGNWRDIPAKHLGIKVSHSCLYRRLDPRKPSPTLGNFRKNMLIHPLEDRHLSLREAARIQSFPDDYYFDGPVTLMQQQIADATPPLLAEAIGRRIRTWLSGA